MNPFGTQGRRVALRPENRTTLGVERLDDRVMMSATLAGGELRVTGSAHDDVIAVVVAPLMVK
jgi:hypothetical protein